MTAIDRIMEAAAAKQRASQCVCGKPWCGAEGYSVIDINDLRAILAKELPAEPTAAMLDAGYDAIPSSLKAALSQYYCNKFLKSVYKAMLTPEPGE